MLMCVCYQTASLLRHLCCQGWYVWAMGRKSALKCTNRLYCHERIIDCFKDWATGAQLGTGG